MQENGFKREEMEKSTYDYRGQDGTHCECKNTEAHKNTCDCRKYFSAYLSKNYFVKFCLLILALLVLYQAQLQAFPYCSSA